jgi:SAM-dependent methyltransferase
VLGMCPACGFISNVAFDPTLHEYSSKYEATQSYSPTFNVFHRNLAQRLIDRYDLHGKDIIEIGCGQGEFLILLCELGGNRGIGFDPAYDSQRIQSAAKERITFIKDFYSEAYTACHGDFVCCKMTLEHIPNTAEFVSTVRRSIGDRLETTVFFQVPSVTRILRDLAFWDIYYEHCSYFTLGSLARLFRSHGFQVLDMAEEYDDQYLMLEARPIAAPVMHARGDDGELVAVLNRDVVHFVENYQQALDGWRAKLRERKEKGQRVVLWGSGSKAVAFLTTLKIQDEVGFVVDINPYKHGTYMAGTGHEIVAPGFLQEYQPHLVVVMNPIYLQEIRQDLDQMGVETELVSVD